MFRLTAGATAAVALLAAAPAAVAQPASAPPTSTAINQLIAEKWKEAEIKSPAKKATDHEFIRRAFIDLVGRIPTVEEVLDYEQDKGADKRFRLVKRLLYADAYQPKVNGTKVPKPGGGKGEFLTFDYAGEYAEHWANIWTVWLMTRSGHPLYREQMRIWLESQFYKNLSYDQLVTQLLTATGASNENGAVNFVIHHIGEANPADKRQELGRFDAVPITSRVTRLFLGLQTQCTQCHDHPFNKEWVQSDFWGVNAYFRQTIRDRAPTPGPNAGGNNQMMANPVQVTLTDDDGFNTSSMVFYEQRNGKLMAAKPNFLKDIAQADAGEVATKTPSAVSGGAKGKSRRQILSEYVLAHDNFAKAYVNRMWGHLFGRGLQKEPSFDDFGSHNEAVHPELMAKLAEEFRNTGYNSKMLLEWICSSDVYNLSHEANSAYTDPKYLPYFARMPLKSLSPEVLYDALMTATKAEASGDQRKQDRDRFMGKLVRNFGDDEGNELTFNGTVVQALLLLNGTELNGEITRKGNNVVAAAMAKHSKGNVVSPAKVIDELFLTTLGRHPSSAELAVLIDLQTKGRKVAAEAPKPAPTPTPAKPVPGNRTNPRQPARPNPAPATQAGWIMPAGPNDATFYQDLFWALLNTNEFILNH